MSKIEKKSKPSTENTKLKFTRGHEILMTGMFGCQMSCREMFKVVMAIETEKEALDLAKWILDRATERNEEFPTPEEVLIQAGINPQNLMSATSTMASES